MIDLVLMSMGVELSRGDCELNFSLKTFSFSSSMFWSMLSSNAAAAAAAEDKTDLDGIVSRHDLLKNFVAKLS